MGYAEVNGWAPWNVEGAHGSYLGGYRINYAHNFSYVTVRGAGHMVPETRPEVREGEGEAHGGGPAGS